MKLNASLALVLVVMLGPSPQAENAPMGFAARPTIWPKGMQPELVQEVPKDWKPKAAPTFSVAPPHFEPGRIVVRGTLANDTSAPVVSYLLSAPHTLGPLRLSLGGDKVRLRPETGPPMPEIYPSPQKLTIPPHTRIVYERVIVLARYDYQAGSAATLTWSFDFWVHTVDGTFAIVLPK